MIKAKINRMFSDLRKNGYVAKQRFWCCQSCAWAALSTKYPENQNAVFYHKQDAEDLDEKGQVHLAWRGDGKIISAIAHRNGLVTEWNGDENTRILIHE